MTQIDRDSIEQADRDDELSRRIREEVVRMQQEAREREEIDEEYKEEIEEEYDEESEAAETAEAAEAEDEPQNTPKKKTNFFKLLFTGNILTLRGVAKYYGQMVVIAGLFLLSIVVMFWSLHLDMEYNTLSRDVQLMRERSVRLQEVRYSRSSHSAIVEELERRGIKLRDPQTPATVIKKEGGLW